MLFIKENQNKSVFLLLMDNKNKKQQFQRSNKTRSLLHLKKFKRILKEHQLQT